MPIHDRIYRRLEVPPDRPHAFPAVAIGRFGLKYALKSWWSRAVLLASCAPTLISSVFVYGASRGEGGVARLAQMTGGASPEITPAAISGSAMETMLVAVDDPLWRTIASVGLLSLFMNQVWFAIILTPMIGSRAIADDLRTQAIDVYLARPIRGLDYFLGKFLSVFAPVFALLAVPPILLLIVGQGLFPESFEATWPFYFKSLLIALILATVNSCVVLGISSFGPSRRYATVLWFLLTFGSFLAQGTLMQALNSGSFDFIGYTANQLLVVFAILDVPETAASLRDLPFRIDDSKLGRNLCVLVGLSAFGVFFVLRRVAAGRKP